MNPQQQSPSRQPANGFEPKYRHFHPLDQVWVLNPFDHDVVWQVADEHNRPFKYKIQAHQRAELPGGAIATLCIKHIVDEMIQNSKNEGEIARMWDPPTRKRYEDQILLRVKETSSPAQTQGGVPGEIDLSVKGAEKGEEEVPVDKQEEAFPGLNSEPVGEELVPLPTGAKTGLDDLVASSLPTSDAVESANNAHPNMEG